MKGKGGGGTEKRKRHLDVESLFEASSLMTRVS